AGKSGAWSVLGIIEPVFLKWAYRPPVNMKDCRVEIPGLRKRNTTCIRQMQGFSMRIKRSPRSSKSCARVYSRIDDIRRSRIKSS
ncbi:hypothetical protein NKH70_24075, partial [Mesorhizobium sp. M0991]|uniref:hypothetical protein n=1 Tax=Mesorhizobium sp. M0991 TaxID=2957043 RepID=UPI0033388F96